MILDSLVIANLVLLAVASASGLYAALHAATILLRWDPESGSATQLALEKRTYLVSTVTRFTLLVTIVSALLFLLTASGLANRVAGAMCAYGTLNANPWGFPALAVKALGVFTYGSWLYLDRVDATTRTQPLTVTRYRALLAIIPIVLLDAALTTTYFLNLDPEAVVSCCSGAFSSSTGVGQSLADLLPPRGLYAAYVALVATLILILKRGRGDQKYLAFSAVALAAFLTGIATATIFVAPHVYEVLHYCPFDLYLPQNSYVGYPLTLLIFMGGIHGAVPGLLHLVAGDEAASYRKKTAKRSARFLVLFGVVTTALVLRYYLSRGTLLV